GRTNLPRRRHERGSRRVARHPHAQPPAAQQGLRGRGAALRRGPGSPAPGSRLGVAPAAGAGVSAPTRVIFPAMKLDRRRFIVFSSGALALSPIARVFGEGQAPAQAPAQAPPPAVPKFEDVRRNIGVFTMRGGTIGWLVNKDASIVIDTQYADTA